MVKSGERGRMEEGKKVVKKNKEGRNKKDENGIQ